MALDGVIRNRRMRLAGMPAQGGAKSDPSNSAIGPVRRELLSRFGVHGIGPVEIARYFAA